MTARVCFGSLCLAWTMAAQAPRWKPPAGEVPIKPQVSCSSLRSLTGLQFTIVTAVLQPAAGDVPEFCRVLGQVLPEVRFEVALPTSWNKRLYMYGNGGYAGENVEATGRAGPRNEALRLGFATAQTNTGHDAGEEPLGSFAVSMQKLYDYAFRAVHVTAQTAKGLAGAYYRTSPMRSYFQGCSTGGRQALISAQRFPQDFDGIICGAPVLDFTGTMLKYTSWIQAQAAAPIPSAKLKLLAERVYAQCDAKDGLQDGLIDDPRRCGFAAAEHLPKCSGEGTADCFTEGEIRTLETIYGDLKIGGERVFPGWPVGAEAVVNGRSGWDGWISREGAPSTAALFAETFFRYFAYPKKDPKLELKQVNLEEAAPRLGWIRKVLDATETDLTGFRDRSGKLLMWYGWADPALNPLMGVEYYESALKSMGPKTRDFFRLFMLPGVFHCGGGPGCAAFDRITPLVEWVELGKTPESLIASRLESGKVVRTRPLCPYPQVAKYKGSGSVDDAANFACAEK